MALQSAPDHTRHVRVKGAVRDLGPAARYIRGLRDDGKVLHLHASCGTVHLNGWLNFDLLDFVGSDGKTTQLDHAHAIDGHCYVKHDAATRYPFPDGAVSSVYSEHFIEHLSLEQGLAWMREAYRLLKPGGVLRLSTPDLEAYCRGYLDEKQEMYNAWARGLRTHRVDLLPRRTFRFNTLMRQWGHQYLYDYDELALILSTARFKQITRCDYRSGTRDIAQHDQAWRRPGSLYLEAKKP
jgi:predicted SAM-dependent methyltransferase